MVIDIHQQDIGYVGEEYWERNSQKGFGNLRTRKQIGAHKNASMTAIGHAEKEGEGQL